MKKFKDNILTLLIVVDLKVNYTFNIISPLPQKKGQHLTTFDIKIEI